MRSELMAALAVVLILGLLTIVVQLEVEDLVTLGSMRGLTSKGSSTNTHPPDMPQVAKPVSTQKPKKKGLGAIVYLAQQKKPFVLIGKYTCPRFYMLLGSIRALQKNFLSSAPYPVYVFETDLDDHHKERLKREIPSIKFIRLDLVAEGRKMQNLSVEETAKMVKKYKHLKGMTGYYSMCAFWSGYVQNRPELIGYDYIMRMDDDSFFYEPVPDLFKLMKEKHLKYMTNSVFGWTTKHMAPAWGVHLKFKQDRGIGSSVTAPISHGPYNNFHISSLAEWQSKTWHDWMRLQGKKKIWFEYMTGDAEVHQMWIDLFANKTEYLVNTRLPYRHNFHLRGGFRHNQKWVQQFAPECLEHKKPE